MVTSRSVFVLALALSTASCRDEEGPLPGGASLHVLFDERHALEGGEPVRMHEFDVGRVESVDLAEARVRATLSIDPKVLAQLTEETTVSVESEGSEAFLLIHVLDTGAPAIEAGATLEGVDSGLELTIRRAGAGASGLLERLGSSEWVKDVDWEAKKQAVSERLEQAKRQMDEAADEALEDAERSFQALREEMNQIAKELEDAGRSDEAKEIRRKMEELLRELDSRAEKEGR